MSFTKHSEHCSDEFAKSGDYTNTLVARGLLPRPEKLVRNFNE
jgi:hypothetical protein